MSASPFQVAREALQRVEAHVQALQSELTRKNAVIARLSASSPENDPIMKDEEQSTEKAGMRRGIFNRSDLGNFLASPTCEEITRFLADLNACARGRRGNDSTIQKEARVDLALDRAMSLVFETPPEELDPQRFGNRAFRKWHAKLCEEFYQDPNDEFGTYLTKSFGDPHRLDFGTGHEAAFLMLMLVIYKQEKKTDNLVHFLNVTFPKYLDVVRKLRAVYRLEPAGSHGVWSLDDYHFLPFVLGSSQLCEGHTRPKDLLTSPSFSELTPGTDLFSDALLDILRSKRGPFKEHSPLLHSLRNLSSWDDVNTGLIKMWKGEVLSKFPVAQHFWFGPTLPITWSHSSEEEAEDHHPQQQQAQSPMDIAVGKTQNDPLAKYFHMMFPLPGAPPPSSSTESTAPAITQQHVLSPDGNAIDIGTWSITSKSESKISGEPELDALRNAFPDELDFPLPEMLFSNNFLRLEHRTTPSSAVRFEIRVDEALRGCKFRVVEAPDRKMIKVTMADKWEERRDQDGNPIKRWRDDYDWTFTTRRLLRVTSVNLEQGREESCKMTRTPRRIDYERLKQREPILWAKEVLLFEDDLFDLGISKLSIKIRVMPSCLFVLARFFLRVDGAHLRCIDSRVFHVFGTKHVLIENSERESDIASLGKHLETKDLIDPNYVATILPLVSEPVTFEVSLV